MIRLLFLAWIGLMSSGLSAQKKAQAPQVPWAPEMRCQLNPARPQGLHPDAYSALQAISVAHRITQGMNGSSDRGNVHQADTTINGKSYTAAVDISVRCLTPVQIKDLLGRLAGAGFSAWYRKQGQDDWTGPPHIHAVWAGSPLKPFLRYQVESWLDGRNGLSSNKPYQFWKATPEMQVRVRSLYRASN
jgi:hypothetical protein